MFLICRDVEGDAGRASFTYYKGYLAAPTNFTATPGDAQVVTRWNTINSSDVDHYLVYFDSQTFTAADTPTACNADLSLCSPVVVEQPDGDLGTGDDDSAGDDDDASGAGDDDDSAVPIGLPYSTVIDQLANRQAWYFAVAAVDSQGNVGPRTAVLSATPSVTGGAAALSGDSGGCTCESSLVIRRSRTALALLVLLALVPLQRRRRTLKRE